MYISMEKLGWKGCNALWTVEMVSSLFRWFKCKLKCKLKLPNSMAIENFFLVIWDTFHWNFFVKFGLKTPYDIS